MSRRIARWCFPVTLALAGVHAVIFLAGLWLEAPVASGFFSRLVQVLLNDPGMRKVLLAAALGLTLTAFLFFRKPRIPIRLRATDV
jgi:hypothetical protein